MTPKRKPIPKATTRQWFLAFILEDWRKYLGPLIRKAYRADTDEQRVELMREIRDVLARHVGAFDSELEA